MRTYLKMSVMLVAASAMACTQPNPAFLDEAGESDAETRGSATDTLTDSTVGTESSDSAEASTSASDTQSSSTATSTTSTDATDSMSTDATDTMSTDATDTDDTGMPACDLPAEDGLRFKIFSDNGVGECPDALSEFYYVEGFTEQGYISGMPCNEGCEACDDGLPVDIEAYPADLSELFPTLNGACLHLQFDHLVAAASNYCEYDKAFILESVNFGDSLPLLIASSGDGGVPPKAAGVLQNTGLTWQVIKDESCECPDNDPCCLPATPPSLFAFDLGGGTILRPGETHNQPDPSGGTWVFDPWQAQLLDSCGANIEVSWMMNFQP